ncbi:RND family transporter, partial [Mycolicibacter hiberniae]|nr:RND family transporter [Mycolicibacter hiberniae]
SNVQGITRPLAAPLELGTLPAQAGYVGGRLTQMTNLLKQRIEDLTALSGRVGQLSLTVRGLEQALQTGTVGATQIHSGAAELRTSLAAVVQKVDSLRGTVKPAEDFIGGIPNCRDNDYCQAALTGFSLFDDLHRFDGLVGNLVNGTGTLAQTLPALGAQLP